MKSWDKKDVLCAMYVKIGQQDLIMNNQYPHTVKFVIIM